MILLPSAPDDSMICASAADSCGVQGVTAFLGGGHQYYSDLRVRATVGLGHLLGTKIVEFKQPEVA